MALNGTVNFVVEAWLTIIWGSWGGGHTTHDHQTAQRQWRRTPPQPVILPVPAAFLSPLLELFASSIKTSHTESWFDIGPNWGGRNSGGSTGRCGQGPGVGGDLRAQLFCQAKSSFYICSQNISSLPISHLFSDLFLPDKVFHTLSYAKRKSSVCVAAVYCCGLILPQQERAAGACS